MALAMHSEPYVILAFHPNLKILEPFITTSAQLEKIHLLPVYETANLEMKRS